MFTNYRNFAPFPQDKVRLALPTPLYLLRRTSRRMTQAHRGRPVGLLVPCGKKCE